MEILSTSELMKNGKEWIKNRIDELCSAYDYSDEIWRAVIGYEGLYEVSSYGRVRSLGRFVKRSDNKRIFYEGRILSPIIRRGYLHVNLCKDLKSKSLKIHRLVASAFIDNPDGLLFVNHKDENTLNNTVDNLEWCTHEYNSFYGTRNERTAKNRRNKGGCAVVGTHVETGDTIIFPSMGEAERNGFNRWCVWACCCGREKTHKNYVWRKIDLEVIA